MNSVPEEKPVLDKKNALGDVGRMKHDLKGKSVNGAVSLLASEIGCNIFRFGGTVILARLLTPEYFGLISMVTALTTFAELWKDFGLGTATIQKREITHEQISTLFWINAGIGFLLMLVLASAAPVIAWFYNDSRLLWVSVAIASTFLFGGLTIQHQALLRREMHFPQLAFIQVLSTGLSTVIGIVLAWKGFTYWALVWKEISRAIIQVCATWGFSHWIPGPPRRGAGVREMFRMGSHVTGFNILVFASRSLDQVLLGRFWGPQPVGFYKQSAMLLMLPASLLGHPIIYMLTPALSALQSDPERYRSYYQRMVSLLAFGYLPLIAYLGIYAESVVSLMLGDQWMVSAAVLQVLAVGALADPIVNTCGIVMITNGRSKDYLYMGVAQASALCLAIVIGVNWGLFGIAVAVVAYIHLTLPLLAWFSFKDTPISPRSIYKAMWLPAVATGIMSLVLVVIRYFVQIPNGLVEILYSSVLAPMIYCGVWLLLPGGRGKLAEYVSHIRLAINAVASKVGISVGATSTTSQA